MADDANNQEHCTAAFLGNGDPVVAYAGADHDIVVVFGSYWVVLTAGTTDWHEYPAVTVTELNSVETIQVITMNEDDSDQFVYWECSPGAEDCTDAAVWTSADTGWSGAHPQVTSDAAGNLFVSYHVYDNVYGHRIYEGHRCDVGTLADTFSSGVEIDGEGGGLQHEMYVVDETGGIEFEWTPYNNVAVNEYQDRVHIVYLKDVDTSSARDWRPRVASEDIATLCPPVP